MPENTILFSGPMLELSTTDDGIVTLTCEQRPDINHVEGADEAKQVSVLIETRVFSEQSLHRGLIIDARKGPPAFGPKTRALICTMFEAALRYGGRGAVLVGGSAVQALQFGSIREEIGVGRIIVTREPQAARRWIRSD